MLLPLVPLDEKFKNLIADVRAARKQSFICRSAQDGVNISGLLFKIVAENVYKEDYVNLTEHLLADKVSYEETITAVIKIAESKMF